MFLVEWIIFYIAIIFTLCIDNIFWINTGGEWNGNAEVSRGKRVWKGPVKDYQFGELVNYIWNYRIMSVITHWRDIIPGVLSSFILTIIWRIV